MRRLLALITLVVAAVAGGATSATAHPLGNFTVNHLVRLTASPAQLRVRYVLDEAEIPSFAVLRGLDRDGRPNDAALRAWATGEARRDGTALRLDVDGVRAALTLRDVTVQTRPGAGGLRTLYLRALFVAPPARAGSRLSLADETYPGRIGWHDALVGEEREPTNGLRAYPSALLGSPRDRLARNAVFADGRLRSAPANGDGNPRAAGSSLARNDALSDALARGAADPLLILGALLLALGLGALHALEPGHGKTLLAVSLVGARATVSQAAILAGALTIAHTAGVFALGAVLLLAARWIVPEMIYPWLTAASGVVVVVLGARALAHEVAHRRSGSHEHGHRHAELGTAALGFRGALAAAVTGNVAPCPAALVVLLAAVTLHRVAYGMLLIVAFSAGLALVLTGLGIAVVRGAAWLASNPRFERAARWGPVVTGVAMSILGAGLLAQGFVQIGVGVPLPLVAGLVLVAVAGYAAGGHRHDHAHGATLAQAQR